MGDDPHGPLDDGEGRKRPPKAKVPVLLIYGGKDDLVRPEASIARAKSLNGQIESKIYENSGHAPFLEEAARFNKDLAAFTASVEGSK